jgi:hypothetical protein
MARLLDKALPGVVTQEVWPPELPRTRHPTPGT